MELHGGLHGVPDNVGGPSASELGAMGSTSFLGFSYPNLLLVFSNLLFVGTCIIFSRKCWTFSGSFFFLIVIFLYLILG